MLCTIPDVLELVIPSPHAILERARGASNILRVQHHYHLFVKCVQLEHN